MHNLHFLVFVIKHFVLRIAMIKFAEILNCSTSVGISVASYRSAHVHCHAQALNAPLQTRVLFV